jgi:hypothetical protein
VEQESLNAAVSAELRTLAGSLSHEPALAPLALSRAVTAHRLVEPNFVLLEYVQPESLLDKARGLQLLRRLHLPVPETWILASSLDASRVDQNRGDIGAPVSFSKDRIFILRPSLALAGDASHLSGLLPSPLVANVRDLVTAMDEIFHKRDTISELKNISLHLILQEYLPATFSGFLHVYREGELARAAITAGRPDDLAMGRVNATLEFWISDGRPLQSQTMLIASEALEETLKTVSPAILNALVGASKSILLKLESDYELEWIYGPPFMYVQLQQIPKDLGKRAHSATDYSLE